MSTYDFLPQLPAAFDPLQLPSGQLGSVPADDVTVARARRRSESSEPLAIEASRVRQAVELLTNSDWDIISAAVGYPVSPNSGGLSAGFGTDNALPLIALAMAGDRRDGIVGPGRPFTAEYFAGWINPISPEGWNEQMQRAIDHLTYAAQPAGRHAA